MKCPHSLTSGQNLSGWGFQEASREECGNQSSQQLLPSGDSEHRPSLPISASFPDGATLDMPQMFPQSCGNHEADPQQLTWTVSGSRSRKQCFLGSAMAHYLSFLSVWRALHHILMSKDEKIRGRWMASAQVQPLSNGCHDGFLKPSCNRTHRLLSLKEKGLSCFSFVLCFSSILSIKISVIFFSSFLV